MCAPLHYLGEEVNDVFGHAILMSPSRSSCLHHRLLFWKPLQDPTEKMTKETEDAQERCCHMGTQGDQHRSQGFFPGNEVVTQPKCSRTFAPKEKQDERTVSSPGGEGMAKLKLVAKALHWPVGTHRCYLTTEFSGQPFSAAMIVKEDNGDF